MNMYMPVSSRCMAVYTQPLNIHKWIHSNVKDIEIKMQKFVFGVDSSMGSRKALLPRSDSNIPVMRSYVFESVLFSPVVGGNDFMYIHT